MPNVFELRKQREAENQRISNEIYAQFGIDDVWPEKYVGEIFDIQQHFPPFCIAIRLLDNERGTMRFDSRCRLYYEFISLSYEP